MAQEITTQRPVPAAQPSALTILPNLLHGALTKLACKCSPNDNADFLIKGDRIICAGCGQEVVCAPPIMGIFKATCACCSSPSIKTTFVLDSKGDYVCTWCGVKR